MAGACAAAPAGAGAGAGAALPFGAVLVANRGEVAVRLVRGVRALGLRAVAVYTPADACAAHVREADAAVAVASYVDVGALVAAAVGAGGGGGCGAVLPGYGFVSEKEEAVRAFEAAGVAWCGPGEAVIGRFGGKVAARRSAEEAGVPCVPGCGVVEGVEEAVRESAGVGFPLLVKASAGGGGMGQAVFYDVEALRRGFDGVVDVAEALFGDGEVYMERYVEKGRHVEVQVFGDGEGRVVAIGDRDCSVQRRRQKVVEEGPAPGLADGARAALRAAAVRLCARYKYRSAGTVEFILDVETGDWFFLEVNTRLQVEHGVSEMVAGVDIVRWMVLLAGGVDVLGGAEAAAFVETGAAVEARIYAECPVKGYAPSAGVLSDMRWPEEGERWGEGCVVRVDSWAVRGTEVSNLYDPLLGKVIVWARTRALAVQGLARALAETVVCGVESNVALCAQVCADARFVRGEYTTGLLAEMDVRADAVEVVAGGLQSSLQDWPGRVGYWDVGVSPSGAVDAYAMGMVNALVGNRAREGCALEMTVTGATLRFHVRTLVALGGARMEAEVDDGRPVAWWTPFWVAAGSVLAVGGVVGGGWDGGGGGGGGGKVAYLAVRGGFDAPDYLGSKSTFPTGGFGGVTGAFIKAGDFLPVRAAAMAGGGAVGSWPVGRALPAWLVPRFEGEAEAEGEEEGGEGAVVTVAAMNGPHGSEDFLAAESLAEIWTSAYTVHHAANRLGVRLIGPTPKWTRADGGSAGLHPSNLHDYTYAPGAVNLSGNTPIVLMLDGPSLGGFVCPITVASADLWKVAQAQPGSRLRFKQVDWAASRAAVAATCAAWDAVRLADDVALARLPAAAGWAGPGWAAGALTVDLPAVAKVLDPAADSGAAGAGIKVTYRMSGDEHVLIEYGEIELDLAYRMRVHMLMEELRPRKYIKELCPGVRSLLVKYDAVAISAADLLTVFEELEGGGVLGSVDDVVVPSRVLRLPLAFNDKWTVDAQERYLRSVRPDAPYMPSNVEFVRRINGLDSVDDVKRIVCEAEYCVIGLGDVYLGAPCAVPVDPRHRLVSSKYNPARTYTPEGAVGIGGSYMCIYGMDSPGGYQLVGRTIPIWDSYGQISEENRGAPLSVPWLLRFFDRVCYYPVSDDELEELRDQYRRGSFKLDITDGQFSFKEYTEFCEANKESIAQFKAAQDASFGQERARWEESGEGESSAAADHASRPANAVAASAAGDEGAGADEAAAAVGGGGAATEDRPPFSVSVLAGVAANVWSIVAKDGDVVERGETVAVLESMKVEISVEAPVAGIVQRMQIAKGDNVGADKEICLIVSSNEQAMKDLSLGQLRSMYKLGVLDPATVVKSLLAKAAAVSGAFTALADAGECAGLFAALNERRKTEYLPLYGIPFCVGASVDVAGLPTSSGCDAGAYVPEKSAAIVDCLQQAGAVLIGKTAMDQYGVGATGTQSLGARVENPRDAKCVVGGAGAAAVAVACGVVTFSVHVDCASSAVASPFLVAGDAVVGLKVTEGLLSLRGVEPSCPSLDSMFVCAADAADIEAVLTVCVSGRESGGLDATLRKMPAADGRPALRAFTAGVIPDPAAHGGMDAAAVNAYHVAVQKLCQLGGTARRIHPTSYALSPFGEAHALKDRVPLDAARHGALAGKVSRAAAGAVLPHTRERILASADASAAELAAGLEALRRLRLAAEQEAWPGVDVLVVPTVAAAPGVARAAEDPAAATEALTAFTSFIAPMDLCSVTLGCVTLVAPAFREGDLLAVAKKWGAL